MKKLEVLARKALRCILHLASCVFVLTGVATAEGQSDAKVLKIGVIGDATGEGSHYYKPLVEGVKQAARDFNRGGGVKGKEIDLALYNTRGEQGKTLAAVQELINSRVLAIIASPGGWSTFGPVSMANSSMTILMNIGSQRHIGKSGPYIFRNSLPDEIATEEMIRFCKEKFGYKKYAIVTSMMDDESNLSTAALYRKAVQKFGGRIIADAYIHYDLSLKDTIKKLKTDSNGSIDGVIFAGAAKDAVEMLKEMRIQGVNAPIIGSENLYSPDFLKSGGEAVAGSLLYASFTPMSGSPATKAFVEKYRKTVGEEPSTFAALGYDSFMLIAEAVKRAGTMEPSKLRDALNGIKNFPGVSGNISMGEDGETIKTPFIIRVEKGGKGPGFRLVK